MRYSFIIILAILVFILQFGCETSGDETVIGDGDYDSADMAEADTGEVEDTDVSEPDGDDDIEQDAEPEAELEPEVELEEEEPERDWPVIADSLIDRPKDPVVLTGDSLGPLVGLDPAKIAAFRYSDGWIQVPIQTDEKRVADFFDIYNGEFLNSTGALETVYADAGTYTGADPDPLIDADDELVFMAHDLGGKPETLTYPERTVPGSAIEVRVAEPENPDGFGYLYIFSHDGTLNPSAEMAYGSYTFQLVNGVYPDDYGLANGPNPEDSTFLSLLYERHFSDRWVTDVIRIYAGDANGEDFLEMYNAQFGFEVCGRSVLSFSRGEGAFVANISGPVRSIRSYIGANSGPLTQREHLFYEGREDIRTFLRVHSIPGIMDFFDYSNDAIGMTYYNDLNTGGVTVDGVPDELVSGRPEWEMITGEPGSLVIAHSLDTDVEDMEITNYYLDEDPASLRQCTGDQAAIGSSGVHVTSWIPWTDPGIPQLLTYHVHAIRTLYFEAPGLTPEDAEQRAFNATHPLVGIAVSVE